MGPAAVRAASGEDRAVTAIRNIELSEPLTAIDDVGGYQRCMVVMRWHGQVVGRAVLPVSTGCVARERLERLTAGRAGREALARWLDESLGYNPRHSRGSTPRSATVAICTRERPDDLARALGAMAALSSAGHELLVVDNAPATSRTRDLVSRFPAARYVVEPRRGLNAARNRALREASGEIVAFSDDDAVPEPAWLEPLVQNFHDRRVLCATGLTLPMELETEAQELFETHCTFVRGFRRRVIDGMDDGPLVVGHIGAGANMAVRRDAILELGGFDERLDAGTPTRSGGDHEMFVRILAAGYHIVYDPASVSWHRHRRTREELLDTVYGYGVGVYAMWTGMLVERQELGVVREAWRWFTKGQLPRLVRRRHRARAGSQLTRAELRGCFRGPRAWLAARRLASAGE
jgi:GT2 family glycosyltransferase